MSRGQGCVRNRIGRGWGGPRPVGEVIENILDRPLFRSKIEDRRIIHDWPAMVGPGLARDTRPLRIEAGVLLIAAGNAAEASHLMYLKPLILEKIRSRHPDARIRDLRVLHRPVEGWSSS